MAFDKCNEVHNHALGLSENQLTNNMIEDLKSYNKKSKVIDIKENLEKKYNISIDYHTLYYEFRKVFPRLGQDDADNMVKILEEKNIHYRTEKKDNKIERLFFSTPRMIRNYELYGDIVLIDSTYRVNQYNLPLIVYSGIDSYGRNILFALAIVNDETGTTHKWCMEKFFELHIKHPNIVMTDQDLALVAVLDKEYPNITNFLCQWHIKMNLKKHCSYLQNMNLKELYNRILVLPFIEKEFQFESEYNDIVKTLQFKKFTKSSEYLANLYIKKKMGLLLYT